MNTLPTGHGGPCLGGDPHQYGISGASRADNNTTSSICADPGTNVGKVPSRYNATADAAGNEELSRIQAWLSPLEPYKTHQDVSNQRLESVGDWVLQRNEYKSWCNIQESSVDPTLLCYGGHGVGKTYLSSSVIDTLWEQARGRDIVILPLYCDYRARKDQSAVNLIGGLLRQVAFGARGVPGEIRGAFDESRQRGGKGLRLPEMLGLFVKAISSMERVYICVDGVDEVQGQDRSKFLRSLRQIIQVAPNARLFLTARPYIRGELDKRFTRGACIINIVASQGDIATYVSERMADDDQDPDLMTGDLKNEITEAMLEKVSGMFLLVAVNMDAILGETSLAGRRKMLQRAVTTGVSLDAVYGQTLLRIREQKGDRSRLGIEVLMWISHSERPLQIDELRHALAVEMESADLDPENVRPQDSVLASCLGLAVVDKETLIVQPIHYTLREYLSRPDTLPGSHKSLAQTCLTYLNYEKVKGLPAEGVSNLGEMPFLEYSSIYWGSHAKMELSDSAKSLAAELLNRYDKHISTTVLFNHISLTLISNKIWYNHQCSFPNHLFSNLHCASYFGNSDVVDALIWMQECDINQRDCMGFTPLMWASWRGNEGVVRLLLAQAGIDPDMANNCFQTPLWVASKTGQEAVVRLLLTRSGVRPGMRDSYGQTPLCVASKTGQEAIVRLLLTRCGSYFNGLDSDAHLNGVDINHRSPLWHASENGHEGVVRLLLARDDVDPNISDKDNRTPLWAASTRGNEEVVKLLLSRIDVNPDKPDNYSKTPLYVASDNGHEGVVRLLYTRGDVNPNRPDENGRTPLWTASAGGREGMVRLLLTRSDVDPDKPDEGGSTPLRIASMCGHRGVVALLRPQATAISSVNHA